MEPFYRSTRGHQPIGNMAFKHPPRSVGGWVYNIDISELQLSSPQEIHISEEIP